MRDFRRTKLSPEVDFNMYGRIKGHVLTAMTDFAAYLAFRYMRLYDLDRSCLKEVVECIIYRLLYVQNWRGINGETLLWAWSGHYLCDVPGIHDTEVLLEDITDYTYHFCLSMGPDDWK